MKLVKPYHKSINSWLAANWAKRRYTKFEFAVEKGMDFVVPFVHEKFFFSLKFI